MLENKLRTFRTLSLALKFAHHYVNYRRQLLDYHDRKVRLETTPDCEAVLEAIETETLRTEASLKNLHDPIRPSFLNLKEKFQ